MSGIKYLHIFLQSPSLSTSRTLSSSKAKTSDVKLISSSPASGNHHCLWTTPGPSCRWNHGVLTLCHWLISPNTVSSGFIHVVTCVRIFFLFKTEKYSTLWNTYVHLFTFQQTLGCFNLLVLVSNVAEMSESVICSVVSDSW